MTSPLLRPPGNGMARSWALAVLLLVPLVAGCLDGEPAPVVDPPDVGDPVGGLADNATLYLEGCSSHSFNTEVPPTWAEPFMPEGFRIQGPLGFAVVMHEACDRVVYDNQTEESVNVIRTKILALADHEWTGDGSLLVNVETLTDSRLVQDAWARFNTTAVPATISCSTQTTVTEDIVECDVLTEEGSLAYTFANAGSPDSPDSYGVRDTENWIPGPPHVRAMETRNVSVASFVDARAVTFNLDGDTETRALFGGASVWRGDHWPAWGGLKVELEGGFGI